MSEQEKDPDLKIKLGQNNEIKIKNKYETFSIANDIAISVVFILGSVLTLAGLSMVATVFYLLGSLGMAARPAIRLKRRTHLQRIGADANTAESYDYQATNGLAVNFQQLAGTYQAQSIVVAAPCPILKSCV